MRLPVRARVLHNADRAVLKDRALGRFARRVYIHDRVAGEHMKMHLLHILPLSAVRDERKAALVFRTPRTDRFHGAPDLRESAPAVVPRHLLQVLDRAFRREDQMVLIGRTGMAEREDIPVLVHLLHVQRLAAILKRLPDHSSQKRPSRGGEQGFLEHSAWPPLYVKKSTVRYPLATFAGYHFWNHAVNAPISSGRMELMAPIQPPIPVPRMKYVHIGVSR